jgi:hypothetical protein
MSLKPIKPSKKTLDELLLTKEVITGKEIIQNITEQERRQKEFEDSVEVEKRYKNIKSK